MKKNNFSSPRKNSDSRPQGRSAPRQDSRAGPRQERSFVDRGDRPNFSDRPRESSYRAGSATRKEGSKPSFFDRPGASSRPRGTVHEKPFSDRPRSDRPRANNRSDQRPKRTERPQTAERPAKIFNKKPKSQAKPFVVHRKNPNDPQELKYYGFHACLNLWKSRPDDIIRVYVEEKSVKQVAPLLKWCATKQKAYHIVSEEEMAKVSDSVHHEGLCVLALEPKGINFFEMLADLNKNSDPSCLLYLDGVQNPHNIGSIMRVCAHFGIKYILSHKSVIPKVTPSAYRVAQGGAEHVTLIPVDDIKTSFKQLEEAGFKTVTTSSHGDKTLYNFKFNPRMIIIMGSESEGVNAKLLESVKDTITIPGTGAVESLNVSVATGLILGEYFRQVKPS